MSRLGHRRIGSIRWSRFSSGGTSSTDVTCRGAGRETRTRSSSARSCCSRPRSTGSIPRYLAWLERWPTAESLAGATAADVIRAWQGLGYNRRALALHRAAQLVARDGWPDDLTTLPGVGPYTAAAISNFALGRNVLPHDVNVDRVERRTRHAFTAPPRRR